MNSVRHLKLKSCIIYLKMIIIFYFIILPKNHFLYYIFRFVSQQKFTVLFEYVNLNVKENFLITRTYYHFTYTHTQLNYKVPLNLPNKYINIIDLRSHKCTHISVITCVHTRKRVSNRGQIVVRVANIKKEKRRQIFECICILYITCTMYT